MAKKFHATPTGQIRPCDATVKPCKYGPELHGETREEVQAIIDKKMTDKHGAFATVSKPRKKMNKRVTHEPGKVMRHGRKITEQEALLRDSVVQMSKELVAERAHNNTIGLEDTDPVKAKKRLDQAIDFADSRGNTHLVKKLAHSDVFPTGHFRDNVTGEKVSADNYIDTHQKISHFRDESNRLKNAITSFAASSDIEDGTYRFENDDAKISMSVKSDQLDDDVYQGLPSKIRESITSPHEVASIEQARKVLSPDLYAKVTKTQMVTDITPGVDRDFGQYRVNANLDFRGDTDDEKIESGLSNLGTLYSDSKREFGGTQKELTAKREQVSSTMKAVVASKNPGRNTFIPAQSKQRGVLLSGREVLDADACKQFLTAEQQESIKQTSWKVDKKKAQEALTDEQFGRLFSKRTASIRVSEK